VDADGLQPDSWYYYRFSNGGHYSITGRTRTMPSAQRDTMRFAVASCQNYNGGTYYHAYNEMTKLNNLDAVIFLGDFMYEGSGSTSGTDVNVLPHHTCVSLQDYRQRYASYKLDSNLRKAQRMWPWYVVWDDHEVANNAWYGGAQAHDSTTQGDWFVRKAAAQKAYFEWQPIRNNPDSGNYHIYRKISFGPLGDLIMLDTRLEGRDEQVAVGDAAIDDTNRTILGATQRAWFLDQLSNSTAQWKIVGQQVMFAPLELPALPPIFAGGPVNTDQWDGYRADRNRVIEHVMSNDIQDVVVLSGDIHSSWGADVPIPGANYDPQTGAGSAFVDFVVPGITLTGANFPVGPNVISSADPHLKYIDLTLRGFGVLTVTGAEADYQWYHVSTVEQADYDLEIGERWMEMDGERFLRPFSDNTGIEPLAYSNAGWLKGIYPNPANDQLNVQFNYSGKEKAELSILDDTGKLITNENIEAGEKLHTLDVSGLAKGAYLLRLSNGLQFDAQIFVKQ